MDKSYLTQLAKYSVKSGTSNIESERKDENINHRIFLERIDGQC